MADKMYSAEYVKRYRPFMPLLTLLQKPKDVERFIILAKSCLTCDAYEELQKIQCPVLVLGGREDLVVSGKASEELAAKIPGATLHMYEQWGHGLYEEEKDFNRLVLDYLIK